MQAGNKCSQEPECREENPREREVGSSGREQAWRVLEVREMVRENHGHCPGLLLRLGAGGLMPRAAFLQGLPELPAVLTA